MPHSLARLSASESSHRDLFSVVFITNIAESDFWYTQVSLAGTGNSARDHSARMAKKPLTFSAICLASSRLRSRPRRGCQTWRVRSIRLSFAECDGFTEDLTAGFSPLRASGLQLRHPT